MHRTERIQLAITLAVLLAAGNALNPVSATAGAIGSGPTIASVRSDRIVSSDPGWTPVTGLTYSMTAIVSVELDGSLTTDPLDKVAIFAGSQIRGVATPTNLGGNWVFFISVGSNTNGEPLSFKFYDASADAVLTICEGLNFLADATRGSIATPYVLHQSGGSAADCALSWAVADGFTASMSILAQVHINGTRTSNPADRVVAFVGNEIRGVGVPFDASGQQVYSIETWGDVNGETLLFRVFKQSNGTTYSATQTTTFAGGTTLGTPSGPFLIESDVTLPIEFEAFGVRLDGAGAVLSWTIDNSGASVSELQIQHKYPLSESWMEQRYGADPSAHGALPEQWETVRFLAPQPASQTIVLPSLLPGTHVFRIRAQGASGEVAYSPEVEVAVEASAPINLSAPYPNPAPSSSQFDVAVSTPQPVRIDLYDALGQHVKVLFEGTIPADANRTISINTRLLAAGLYTIVAVGKRQQAIQTLAVIR